MTGPQACCICYWNEVDKKTAASDLRSVSPMRILVTGVTGLIGPYVVEAAIGSGCEVVTTGRSGGDIKANLEDFDETKNLISAVRPDAVVHAAAMTDVDRCEADPCSAFNANAFAVRNLALALPMECQFVYISSDQVYPDKPGPHSEGDEAPVNQYGRSKLAGEWAALTHRQTCVLRTNVFGPSRTTGRSSLSDFITLSLSSGRPVTLFADILFSPLHLTTVANLLIEVTARGLSGVFNAGSHGGTSKAEFGLSIARGLGLSTSTIKVGTSDVMTSRAPRPHDMRLNVQRLEDALGRRLPTLQDELNKLELPLRIGS